jgi:hypothetical protein
MSGVRPLLKPLLHSLSMNNTITNFRVVKKLAPSRPGAVKLSQRYGESLVCVRHRIDPTGKFRITTVELVVDSSPIQASPHEQVTLANESTDRSMRATLMEAGATWDSKGKVWRMPMKVARALNLQKLVTQK